MGGYRQYNTTYSYAQHVADIKKVTRKGYKVKATKAISKSGRYRGKTVYTTSIKT